MLCEIVWGCLRESWAIHEDVASNESIANRSGEGGILLVGGWASKKMKAQLGSPSNLVWLSRMHSLKPPSNFFSGSFSKHSSVSRPSQASLIVVEDLGIHPRRQSLCLADDGAHVHGEQVVTADLDGWEQIEDCAYLGSNTKATGLSQLNTSLDHWGRHQQPSVLVMPKLPVWWHVHQPLHNAKSGIKEHAPFQEDFSMVNWIAMFQCQVGVPKDNIQSKLGLESYIASQTWSNRVSQLMPKSFWQCAELFENWHVDPQTSNQHSNNSTREQPRPGTTKKLLNRSAASRCSFLAMGLAHGFSSSWVIHPNIGFITQKKTCVKGSITGNHGLLIICRQIGWGFL